MNLQDRYSSAVNSKNLQIDPRTYQSDTDVLGAYGLAGKAHPLAISLSRLMAGNNGVVSEVICILSAMILKKSRGGREKVYQHDAEKIAAACIAWYRHGTCYPCGGHGKIKIPGTQTLGDKDCKVCNGTGKLEFERNFPKEFRELAKWTLSTIEKQVAIAGTEAKQKL